MSHIVWHDDYKLRCWLCRVCSYNWRLLQTNEHGAKLDFLLFVLFSCSYLSLFGCIFFHHFALLSALSLSFSFLVSVPFVLCFFISSVFIYSFFLSPSLFPLSASPVLFLSFSVVFLFIHIIFLPYSQRWLRDEGKERTVGLPT